MTTSEFYNYLSKCIVDDQLLKTGKISSLFFSMDPARIFLTSWANGLTKLKGRSVGLMLLHLSFHLKMVTLNPD